MPSVTCPICASGRGRTTPWSALRYGSFEYCYLECDRCGSYFADPMPGADELLRMYGPGYVDEHYAEGDPPTGPPGEIARELEATAALVATLSPGATLLDVGCGAGVFLQKVSARGVRAVGHELNAATAARAARRVGIDVLSGELATLTQRFDLVHAADVIEHLPAPLDALRAMIGILAPGGKMVLRGPLERQRSLFESVLTLRARVRGRLGTGRVVGGALELGNRVVTVAAVGRPGR